MQNTLYVNVDLDCNLETLLVEHIGLGCGLCHQYCLSLLLPSHRSQCDPKPGIDFITKRRVMYPELLICLISL